MLGAIKFSSSPFLNFRHLKSHILLQFHSGCGGLDSGVFQVGFTLLAMAEVTPYATKTLSHWLEQKGLKILSALHPFSLLELWACRRVNSRNCFRWFAVPVVQPNWSVRDSSQTDLSTVPSKLELKTMPKPRL